MIHWRNASGIQVAICGERGLGLKFSIQDKYITCQPCIERLRAGAERRRLKFEKIKAYNARQRG